MERLGYIEVWRVLSVTSHLEIHLPRLRAKFEVREVLGYSRMWCFRMWGL